VPGSFRLSRLTLSPAAQRCRVNGCSENFYAVWREQGRDLHALRDGSAAPPEKLLQAIWQHQRIHRDRLQTADGRNLRVLHPGFMSVEGGPDFRGAVLQFENDPPVSGDVEIDLQPAGWHAHGHDRNPGFKHVILQVVWDEPKKPEAFPVLLPLKPVLDTPLAELALALENESPLPEALRGHCAALLRDLAEPQRAELLHAAAHVRFHNKAARLLTRAGNSGGEQALWENLFRALGYKNNVWPMQHLAESKSIWLRGAASAFEIQVRLLGVSGLLPDELTRARKSSDTFLRRAWDGWWRDRDALESCILPRSVWNFHGQRPANHPQRRLALAAHWLASQNLIPNIEAWGATDLPDNQLVKSLHALFQVECDDFWSWHWTFKSARLTQPQPLLGAARVTDLAVNVVLPWLWVRGAAATAPDGSGRLQREALRRFFAWPAAADNAVLKRARQRLLGTSPANGLASAAAQQGLLQIVSDFCDRTNAICSDCRFPDLVRSREMGENKIASGTRPEPSLKRKFPSVAARKPLI